MVQHEKSKPRRTQYNLDKPMFKKSDILSVPAKKSVAAEVPAKRIVAASNPTNPKAASEVTVRAPRPPSPTKSETTESSGPHMPVMTQSTTHLTRGNVPKASEVLASEIRRMILSKGLKPGTQMPSESELIELQGLSRATVREALRLLESEGLIMVKRGPRGGIFVGEPNPSHVARSLALLLTMNEVTWRDLCAFRKLVEPAAAAAAALHATEQQRKDLLQLAASGLDGHGDKNHAFHALVAQSSGNELFAVVVTAVEESAHWFTMDGDVEEWDLEGAVTAHTRIAKAIAEGNPDEAERIALRHLEAFEANAEEKLSTLLLPRSRWASLVRTM